ncbi:hypothetical protein ARMSODRAFT_1088691 [Armillaria solidipes]|uniref:Uncharacterized protein n=1 Tax=Armillaria solidipes TaxID=1076256 RepID=A0A2H3AWN8_9AGAR|nr:hypothetical protein ARMSODRAFT_1088691 [Armillaria solidipes]
MECKLEAKGREFWHTLTRQNILERHSAGRIPKVPLDVLVLSPIWVPPFQSLPIPSPPPPIFSSSPKTAESIHSQLLVLAESLAKDLTQHKLFGRLSTVHGLWKNTVALSVNDDGLREVIHAAWGVYLTAAGWTDGRLHLRKGKLIPGYQ